MAVTNRETMLENDDLTESPRPGQPASRLRRALDIARQSVEQPPVDAPATDAEPHNRVPPETVTADTVPRAPLRPLEFNGGADPATAATRHRPGRGLDALLPRNPVDDTAELET
jgi:nitric oxide reductase activation protein